MLDSAIGDARSVNVIIGAGFTGSALTIQLLRQLRNGSHILLVGAPGSIGRGLAYGTRAEQHLLNVRANRMSILSDDSDHFVNWLAAAEEGFPLEGAADSYAKRLVYGRYIRETARAGDREKTRSCRV